MKGEKYVHYDVERLRHISIRSVANLLGEVKRYGATYMTLCPWHEDHHPSLSLVERTGENYCHCFSCDKGGDVIAFVMAAINVDFQGACEWLSRQYGILTSSNCQYIPHQKRQRVPINIVPALTYIPIEMSDRLISVENSLCQCLMRWYQPEAVERFVWDYRIGCYTMNGKENCTVFPSIDLQGRVCNLKVQCYDTDPDSPRFAHGMKDICYWLAKIWQKEGRLPADGNYNAHCLFGEHLLAKYPAQTVALVESPKNAFVGALEQPQLLWLATGNKYMLQRKYLEALRGRDVIVIPDCDAVDKWKETIDTVRDIANFIVNDFCQRMAPEDQPKYDIADYFIDRHLKASSRTTHREF